MLKTQAVEGKSPPVKLKQPSGLKNKDLDFPKFQQNVSMMVKQATEPLAKIIKEQSEIMQAMKSQQDQFMEQQVHKQESLQKRVSTVVGSLRPGAAVVAQGQGWGRVEVRI